jgi:two-component system sensor histidine kinase/response regulator
VLAVAYSLAEIDEVVTNVAMAQGIRLALTDQNGLLLAADGAVANDRQIRRSDPRVAAAMHGQSGTVEVDTPAGPVLSAFGPVPSIGWTITAEIPSATAFAAARGPRHTVLGVAVVLGALLAVGLALHVERIRHAVEALAVPAALDGPVTVSAGVAVFDPTLGATAHDMLLAADAALYRAKAAGRNRIECAQNPAVCG